MKLISWNVNGLRACVGKGFFDFFKEEDADIFCLGETKMQPEQADFSFEGYYPYWNSAEKKGYSGVAVFTKHQPLSVAYGLGIDEHDHEGRVLTLEFESFYLVNVYVPNSQNELARLDYRMKWEDDFRAYVCALDQKKPVVITWRAQNPETTGVYSWWSYRFQARAKNAGWRIDYFLVSDRLMPQVTSTQIYTEVLGSDHCPVGLELSV